MHPSRFQPLRSGGNSVDCPRCGEPSIVIREVQLFWPQENVKDDGLAFRVWQGRAEITLDHESENPSIESLGVRFKCLCLICGAEDGFCVVDHKNGTQAGWEIGE